VINFLISIIIGGITGGIIGFILEVFSSTCYLFCQPWKGALSGSIIAGLYFLITRKPIIKMKTKKGKLYLNKDIYLGEVIIADDFLTRLIGLMFKKGMPEGIVGYYFPDAHSLHTLFMRFQLDIIFLDREMKVKKIYKSVKPYKIISCKGATSFIEVRAGYVNKKGILPNASFMILF